MGEKWRSGACEQSFNRPTRNPKVPHTRIWSRKWRSCAHEHSLNVPLEPKNSQVRLRLCVGRNLSTAKNGRITRFRLGRTLLYAYTCDVCMCPLRAKKTARSGFHFPPFGLQLLHKRLESPKAWARFFGRENMLQGWHGAAEVEVGSIRDASHIPLQSHRPCGKRRGRRRGRRSGRDGCLLWGRCLPRRPRLALHLFPGAGECDLFSYGSSAWHALPHQAHLLAIKSAWVVIATRANGVDCYAQSEGEKERVTCPCHVQFSFEFAELSVLERKQHLQLLHIALRVPLHFSLRLGGEGEGEGEC